MSDLINRDALPEIRIEIPKRLDDETCRILKGIVEAFQTIIRFAPAVDAVEVVRCKDCKYAFFSKLNSETIICGNTKMCGTTDANFFCANGVKRDGGTDNDKGASEE